ncbi:MAG TPA: type II secretion system protein [Candidatus Saccharimonadia bacterium]|nr:type II secretion system protein [Candidatus Saccharimonadia bacterium]
MAIRKQLGFTLVEIVIVIAITGAIAVIALVGQRGLRSRAQFDAGVDKLVASVANAHNQATAGVQVSGLGNGSVNCAGGASPVGAKYIFAGVAWSAVDAPAATFALDFYATQIDAATGSRLAAAPCIFNTETVAPGTVMRVNNPPPGQMRRVLFVRDDAGGLNICRGTGAVATVAASFRTGTCVAPAVTNAAPGLTITLSDPDGHQSSVLIDVSGLAKRLN